MQAGVCIWNRYYQWARSLLKPRRQWRPGGVGCIFSMLPHTTGNGANCAYWGGRKDVEAGHVWTSLGANKSYPSIHWRRWNDSCMCICIVLRCSDVHMRISLCVRPHLSSLTSHFLSRTHASLFCLDLNMVKDLPYCCRRCTPAFINVSTGR